MKFTKRIASLVMAVSAAVSFLALPAYAEESALIDEPAEEESAAEEESYITSGDYKYSVQTGDDGNEVAFLEEYIGSDTKIEIPEEIDGYTVTGLGDYTFYLNDKITEVTISENLADFGYFPFYGCTSLTEFKVNDKNEIYTTDSDGAIVGRDGLAIMAYPTGKNPEKYTVADGIVAINASTFAMCSNLKEITFPESVEFIGNFAFAECTSLESIVLPENLSALSNFMFSGCTALKDVTLPENLQKIGNASFYKCESLELIDFPVTLSEIGQAAFCSTGMTSVTIPATVSLIGYSAFGFHTDDNDQIVADENFVVMGYNGSYAQTYCKENEVSFVSLDEPEDDSSLTEKNSSEEKGLKPGVIAGICVAAAAVIIIVVVILVNHGKNKDEDDEDGEDESDEYDDTEDEE
ncbi:MAG: leucine-rich repeat domain-containing protein [Oscillospiraceae bacterium]|nr:leucine-rich repeat domain-containing protein [Oscillospiraceae bacterium]